METDSQEFILSDCEIPPMPVVAQRVMNRAMDPDCDAENLSEIIAVDEGLVSHILKIANSTFYNYPKQVSNITSAIAILGLQTIKKIAISFAAKNTFDQHSYADQLLWEHSFTVGVGSEIIARRLGMVDVETAFVCGLLHDVGKVLLNKFDPDQYGYVLEKAYQGTHSCADEERERFEFTHCDIGSMLAFKWNLPDELERTIWLHHQTEPGLLEDNRLISSMANIVRLADAISYKLNRYKPVGNHVFEQAVEKQLEFLEVSPQQLEEITIETNERLKSVKYSTLFDLTPPNFA